MRNRTVEYCEGFEVCTAMTMNNAVVWNVAPCRFYKKRRFRGTYRKLTDMTLQQRNILKILPIATAHGASFMYLHVLAYKRIYRYTCVYVYMCVYVCTEYIRVCAYVYICVCMYI
jgi:hypothetical protein